jgi:hypothetical protein
METTLRGVTYESCVRYPADVIVIGRMFQEHLFNLRKVLKWFREDRLKLKTGKLSEESTFPPAYLRHLKG